VPPTDRNRKLFHHICRLRRPRETLSAFTDARPQAQDEDADEQPQERLVSHPETHPGIQSRIRPLDGPLTESEYDPGGESGTESQGDSRRNIQIHR